MIGLIQKKIMKDYKWFNSFIIIANFCFLLILFKNYFIINYTEKVNFELIEINKRWSRHSYVSSAILKIEGNVYKFEVQAEYYDIYKKTGKIDFKVYYDSIFKKYITTADFYFAKKFIYLLILINLLVFTSLNKKIFQWIEICLNYIIDKLNKILPS